MKRIHIKKPDYKGQKSETGRYQETLSGEKSKTPENPGTEKKQ